MKAKLDAQTAKVELEREREKQLERERKLAEGGFANLAEVWIADNLELVLANPYATVATLIAAFMGLLLCAFPRGKKPARSERQATPVPTAAAAPSADTDADADVDSAEPTEEMQDESSGAARPAAPKKQRSRSKRAD
jgi:hypothetical protein